MSSNLLPPGTRLSPGNLDISAHSLLSTPLFCNSPPVKTSQSSPIFQRKLKTHLFEKHVPLSSTYLYTILIKSPSPLPSSHGCTWYCPILTPLSLHKLYVFTLHVLILLEANRDISIFALCISSGPCGFYPQIVACDFGHLGAKAAQGTV